jgi:sugar transferase (PEP-CTERM/EpsH1 system associated)
VRILFLSPRQCWPTRSGAKLREYHLLRALAHHGELTYLYFADPGAPPLTRADLLFCHEIVGLPKPDSYGPAKLLRGLAGRWPLPILNYTSKEMSSAIRRLADSTHYDAIHLDSIHMMRYASALRGRVIYNWHNIESEAMRRYAATMTSAPRRWYAGHTSAKLEGLEREILQTAFGHIVCSERERDQLLQIVPRARIAVIHNGVDMQYFDGSGTENTAGRNLVFVGSMDYYPNALAAASFTESIWPRVRERMPDARLLIVGANPGASVRALASVPGIEVTGTVPDVRPYYRDALAAIVPVRTGGGTRLKILEAMAAGVPVISTPLGAEGLDVTPGKDILLAGPDDAEQWLGHLLRLLEPSGETRKALVNAALELARTRYDWETLGETLWSTYRDWIGSDS